MPSTPSATATVRVRAVHAGRPAPVDLATGATHRPGDLVVAADGLTVLVDADLVPPGHHVLDVVPDDDGPRFVLAPAGR
ncbi:hypothetical protein [Actinomycetospora chiangmaiensis]|uniref:hypothetical protein n=1 Tax=Actinomycetospora chiangmaiensis TaxID=402650 RepID=UPI00035CC45E|nr:hypothetical protein [Actinomycetospora chiangmaiensis]